MRRDSRRDDLAVLRRGRRRALRLRGWDDSDDGDPRVRSRRSRTFSVYVGHSLGETERSGSRVRDVDLNDGVRRHVGEHRRGDGDGDGVVVSRRSRRGSRHLRGRRDIRDESYYYLEIRTIDFSRWELSESVERRNLPSIEYLDVHRHSYAEVYPRRQLGDGADGLVVVAEPARLVLSVDVIVALLRIACSIERVARYRFRKRTRSDLERYS